MFLLLKNEQTFKVCFDLSLFGRFALCILSIRTEKLFCGLLYGVYCTGFFMRGISKKLRRI